MTINLAKKQAVLDDHEKENEVEDMQERLQDLVKTTEPVMPHTSDVGDHRHVVRSITGVEYFSLRLNQVHDSLILVVISNCLFFGKFIVILYLVHNGAVVPLELCAQRLQLLHHLRHI